MKKTLVQTSFVHPTAYRLETLFRSLPSTSISIGSLDNPWLCAWLAFHWLRVRRLWFPGIERGWDVALLLGEDDTSTIAVEGGESNIIITACLRFAPVRTSSAGIGEIGEQKTLSHVTWGIAGDVVATSVSSLRADEGLAFIGRWWCTWGSKRGGDVGEDEQGGWPLFALLKDSGECGVSGGWAVCGTVLFKR